MNSVFLQIYCSLLDNDDKHSLCNDMVKTTEHVLIQCEHMFWAAFQLEFFFEDFSGNAILLQYPTSNI